MRRGILTNSPEAIRPNPLQTFGLLLLLSAIWGGSYLFIRISAPLLGPIPLMAVRVGLAALALLLYARLGNNLPDFRSRWKQFLLLGALNNAIPFTLIASATIHLNASIASILNATTPLFAAVVASVWAREPFGVRRAAGLVAGFSGVVVLMGFSPLPLSGKVVLAAGQALLAALSYGFAAVYARSRFRGVPPLHTSVGQLVGATLLLTPLAVPAFPQTLPGPGIWLAVVTLALVCTSFAYLIYFRLIATAGSTQAATVTFLVPFFSVLWGVIFLNEPLSLGMFGGLALILGAVWLVLAG